MKGCGFLLIVTLFLFGCNKTETTGKTFDSNDIKSWASTPPMGWNSYNSFGAAVTEAEVRANAKFIAENLKEYGWEYVVIDYCWFYPHPPGSIQNNPPQFRLKKDNAPVPWMPMDEYGRLLPDPRKFPSSANGKGFKPLADYIHSLGLKFGIHVMRGIPRQAVWLDCPVKGSQGVKASMISDTVNVCPWLNSMYGIDMSRPGAQAYYNSIIELYKSWEVDYIKVDDIDLRDTYTYKGEEAEAVHKAILNNGRPIVLSLSLNMKLENGKHLQEISNLWRISKDFWDEWRLLKDQFPLSDNWTKFRQPGNWPDADMLQLGVISRRGPNGPERESRFTKDEQRTHMTLWSISQSPLMMGGDLTVSSDFTISLLSNKEVMDVNQKSKNSRQLYRENGKVIWVSESIDGKAKNVAFFNLNDSEAVISVTSKMLGLRDRMKVRNLWELEDMGSFDGKLKREIPPHGCELFRIVN